MALFLKKENNSPVAFFVIKIDLVLILLKKEKNLIIIGRNNSKKKIRSKNLLFN